MSKRKKVSEKRASLNIAIGIVKDIVPGCFAGCCKTLAGYPFDTLKVRMQINPSKQNMVNVFMNTLRRESVSGLYKGVASPLLMNAFSSSLAFGIYSMLYPIRRKYQKENNPKYSFAKETLAIFFCGSIAGLGYLQACAPLELLKILMQANTQKVGEARTAGQRGVFDCFIHTVRTRGIIGKQSLMHGYTITMYRELGFFGIYFWLYEMLKRYFVKDQSTTSIAGFTKTLLIGGTSGVIPWVLTYPIDFFKSRIQSDFNKNIRTELFSAGRNRYQVRELFQGVTPCIVRSFIMHSVAFASWELMKKYLGVDKK